MCGSMATLAFSLRQTVVPIVGKAAPFLFPVRRVYCFGQNFVSHANETNYTPHNTELFFFAKPTDALVTDKDNFANGNAHVSIRYPTMTESYHHQVELVVALGPKLSGEGEYHTEFKYTHVPIEGVKDIIFGYAVGLDMTRRDMQLPAKQKGLPWDLAKGADDSAVISPLVRASELRQNCPKLFLSSDKKERDVVCNGTISLKVNHQLRQRGNMDWMLHSIEEVVSLLSMYVTLKPGDLIYMGTPSGVGPVRRGDVILASIEGVGSISASVL